MGLYKSGTKAFTITAANVGTLDTAALTLYTFDQPSNRILVPRALKLRYKPGGGAFVITRYNGEWGEKLSDRRGKDTVGTVQPKFETYQGGEQDLLDDDVWNFSFTKRYYGTDATAKLEKPVFKVSMRDLGLLGTTATGLIALPISSGTVYTNDKYSLVVKGNGNTYSGGTGVGPAGSIVGDLFFDEYFVG